MKIAHFEIISELEETLERNLHKKLGPEYSLFVNPDPIQLKEAENGNFSYDCLEIYCNGEKYTTDLQEEKFWKIINELEKEDKISDIYHIIELEIKEKSPLAFQEEIEFSTSFRKTLEDILTFIIIIFTFLFLFFIK